MERRLAAILAADVVGYSRLIRADEEGTLAAFQALRAELVNPKLTSHRGRIVKAMGDGILVEFASVVDAVRAADELQQAIAERNAGLPADKRIIFRIGVNLGDVVIEGDDIHGDGVNVAARLEGLAEPGGICISGGVYEQVRDRTDLAFEDMGEHSVKNIDRPLRVWRWIAEKREEALPAHASARPPRSDKPSIAVLPFDNMSGDPEQEYFSDGITEDLITALGRCRWLLVIARNSTFAYKGKSIDVRRVSEELGVRYILEGSVRRSGNRIRVTAQLADGRDGSQLWSERYDREFDDVFALQDEITAEIAGTIEPELESIEQMAIRTRSAVDLNAWDCYQRGLWHLYRFTTEELMTAQGMFERAIALDPNFSQAYARLAYVHIQLGWYGPLEGRAARASDAVSLARKAVELDSQDPAARLSLGRALAISGALPDGVEELRAAVRLDPSFAQAHFALGQALCGLDQHDEARREANLAVQLSPRDPHLWTFLHVRGISNYIADELEAAEADEHAALRQPNVTFYPYTVLVPVLGRLGKMAEAQAAIAALHRFRPGFTCADAVREWYFGEHPLATHRFLDQFAADMRNAGLPE
ncbi:MAG: adenylate cyclase [Alphaproteobacteria bacterium]|nr:adenylate cyclase [Alphaproteobacteria bacterium]